MTNWVFANHAVSSLSEAINGTATTIQLQSGDGSLFPSISGNERFLIVLEDRRSGRYEVCRVSGISGDTLTLESRGLENSDLFNGTGDFAIGDVVALRVTSGIYGEIFSRLTDVEDDGAYMLKAGGTFTGPVDMGTSGLPQPLNVHGALTVEGGTTFNGTLDVKGTNGLITHNRQVRVNDSGGEAVVVLATSGRTTTKKATITEAELVIQRHVANSNPKIIIRDEADNDRAELLFDRNNGDGKIEIGYYDTDGTNWRTTAVFGDSTDASDLNGDHRVVTRVKGDYRYLKKTTAESDYVKKEDAAWYHADARWYSYSIGSNRSVGTIYTNNSGYMIQVAVGMQADSGEDSFFEVSKDKTTWIEVFRSGSSGSSHYTASIPAGHHYRVTQNGGASATTWSELRDVK